MAQQLDNLWAALRLQLQRTVDESTFDIWLADLAPISLSESELTLSAPDRLTSWLDRRWTTKLAQTAAPLVGRNIKVSVVPVSSTATSDQTNKPTDSTLQHPVLNPRYTMDQFVIGTSNRFAHAATLAVAERPAQAFSPLFIYGPPGLGKTHLLHAIGNYMAEHAPEIKVTYATAEQFTNTFVSGLKSGSIDEFKHQLRTTEILLIDDVQFLENKHKTEEEFFHTFNALHESGKQLVITSDRMPAEMASLALRTRERFESGLVVDISPPDIALRTTILRRRAFAENLPINDDNVFLEIAQRVTSNIRSLEGALIRVVAYASLGRSEITVDLTRQVLGDIYPTPSDNSTYSISDIQNLVAARFQLKADDLESRNRSQRVSYARQLAMYVACELTDETLPAIGSHFNRDHATVIYSRKQIAAKIAVDPEASRHARELIADVRSVKSNGHGC